MCKFLLAACFVPLPLLLEGGKVPGLCDCLSAEAAAGFGDSPGVAVEELGLNATTYGIGCARHDGNSAVCTQHKPECENVFPPHPHCKPPAWCEKEWCYVNPEQCSLTSGKSDYFPGRTYSYATCGYTDYYTRAAASLANKVVKVGWKANTGGWRGVYHPTGESYLRDGGYFGPVAGLVKQTAAENEWILNSTVIPEDVAKLCPYTSSFSCCVWATGLGYLDICGTEATMTALRASLSEFYQTSDETSHLVVASRVRWYDTLLKPFRPFQPLSWLCILLVIVIVLLARLAPRFRLECRACQCLGKFWSTQVMERLGRSATDSEEMGKMQSVRWSRTACGVKVSLLRSNPKFTCASCGLQIFFELVFATYTANLFLHLVITQEKPFVANMEQVNQSGLRICVQRTDVVGIKQEYPDQDYALDPLDGELGIIQRDNIFEYMDSGVCDVGITTRQDFERTRSLGRHCEKLMLEASVWKVPMGIAINPAKSGSISSAMHQQRESGWWHENLEDLRPSEDACIDSGSSESSLALTDMLGLIAITGFLMLIGYCFDLAKWRKQLHRTFKRRLKLSSTWKDPCPSGSNRTSISSLDDLEFADTARDIEAPPAARRATTPPCLAESEVKPASAKQLKLLMGVLVEEEAELRKGASTVLDSDAEYDTDRSDDEAFDQKVLSSSGPRASSKMAL